MEWKKIDDKTFELYENHQRIGTLRNEKNNSYWDANGRVYRCQLKSYWKQKYELKDDRSNTVGDLHPKNWYGSSSVLTLNGASYFLKFVNNPLAALQLTNSQGDFLIQAHITTEVGRAKSECIINPSFVSNPAAFWLTSIVWSRFYSIAQNECGDETATLLLLLS